MDVRAAISKIWDGETTGLLSKDDIALDFTISNMMSGVLGLRDTNRDGFIGTDDFQINLSFIEAIDIGDAEGFNFDGAMIKDENGVVLEDIPLDGLTVFLGEWQGVQKTAATSANYKYTPNDINQLLAFVLSLLEDGAESLSFLLGDLDSSFDTKLIEDNINEIAGIINYYWYNDGVDNDGDGRIDEEIINGKDDDGDGFYDEDTRWDSSYNINQGNKVNKYVNIYKKWERRLEQGK